MRRLCCLLLLVACREERVQLILPAPVEAPGPVVTGTIATAPPSAAGSTLAGAKDGAPAKPADLTGRRKATAVHDAMLGRRKALAGELASAEARIAELEAQLKVTGPRNQQRALGEELGRAKGKRAELRAMHDRCEEAFSGEDWAEIDSLWQAAEDASARADVPAADESYSRMVALIEAFRAQCLPLEPMQGGRKR